MHACRHRLGPDQRQPGPSPLSPAPRAPAIPRHHPCLAPLPAPLGLRFRALLGLGFVPPPEPRPCVHCASIAYALLPAARVPLCRHRADPESSSRPLPSGSPVRIAPVAPTARRRPHRAHRAPTSASPPPSLSSRCGGPRALAGKNRVVCIPFSPNAQKGPLPGNIRPKCMHFEIKMATSSPHASISGRNRAIRDTWRANLAAKGPLSRRGARNHAWREDVANAARPFRGSGMRSGRTGFAPCDSGMRHGRTGLAPCGAGLACLPHARPLPSRLCPPRPAPPAICPRSSPPSYTRRASPPALCPPRPAIRRAVHCGRGEPSIRLFLPPSCCPRRPIAPIDARSPAPPGPRPARTEPQPRANRTPAPRQPSPGPPVEPSAPIRALPPAAPRPAARVPLRFR